MKDKSVTTNDSNNSVAIRDQIRQATALQDQLNLEEIRLCNELIERLKQENAKLEFQVVEQKSEISVLTNQINEMQGTAGARLSSMDKKEIEGLIKRLREDLDKTKAERRANDLKVVESEQVIAKLSAQIRELKQRLTSRDDVLSGEQQMLLA
jgi:peptidoglycan hydrolase CwlO-like protein